MRAVFVIVALNCNDPVIINKGLKFMRLLVFLIFGLVTFAAEAVEDEVVIQKMAHEMYGSVEEIREHYKTGCESGVTDYMSICAAFQSIAIDMDLNITYKKLLEQLTTKSAKQKLIKAQRAWINFRNLSCEYESAGYEGGTGHGMQYSSCLASIAEARLVQLKEYLKCDVPGCPGI